VWVLFTLFSFSYSCSAGSSKPLRVGNFKKRAQKVDHKKQEKKEEKKQKEEKKREKKDEKKQKEEKKQKTASPGVLPSGRVFCYSTLLGGGSHMHIPGKYLG
jgi:FKBP-type peptidyl-prolyl cis-trans isomerase